MFIDKTLTLGQVLLRTILLMYTGFFEQTRTSTSAACIKLMAADLIPSLQGTIKKCSYMIEKSKQLS